jgi:3-dehydro-4-phosphotetronate decarboxylase
MDGSMSRERDLGQKLIMAGKYMLTNGLVWGSAGNISVRLDEGTCLITASGTNLGCLRKDDLVTANITGSREIVYSRKPSKELPMHAAVYAERPDIQAVLHGAPFYSTMISCSGLEIPANWFVEGMYYLERVARIPYQHPGSMALADAVREKANLANVLLLENHGVLVYDHTIDEALQGLHTLEVVCSMLAAARQSGIELRPLPDVTVSDFLLNSGYRPRRSWDGDLAVGRPSPRTPGNEAA